MLAEHLFPPGPVPGPGVTAIMWSPSQRHPQSGKDTDTLANTPSAEAHAEGWPVENSAALLEELGLKGATLLG